MFTLIILLFLAFTIGKCFQKWVIPLFKGYWNDPNGLLSFLENGSRYLLFVKVGRFTEGYVATFSFSVKGTVDQINS